MAEQGRTLEEILSTAKEVRYVNRNVEMLKWWCLQVTSSMGTMGLALGPCSLPGQVNHHPLSIHCSLWLRPHSTTTMINSLIVRVHFSLWLRMQWSLDLGFTARQESPACLSPMQGHHHCNLLCLPHQNSEMSYHHHLHFSRNRHWLTTFHLRDAVKAILTHMTNPSSATALSLASSGERLAVIVNNLGGTSKLEELVRRARKLGMHIMWRHLISQ